jgi:hypothetical protein
MANIVKDIIDKLLKFIRPFYTKERTEKQRIGDKLDEEEFWPRDKFEKESYERLKKKGLGL